MRSSNSAADLVCLPTQQNFGQHGILPSEMNTVGRGGGAAGGAAGGGGGSSGGASGTLSFTIHQSSFFLPPMLFCYR